MISWMNFKWILPQILQIRAHSCQYLAFSFVNTKNREPSWSTWTSDQQNCQVTNGHYFKLPNLWQFVMQPQKANTSAIFPLSPIEMFAISQCNSRNQVFSYLYIAYNFVVDDTCNFTLFCLVLITNNFPLFVCLFVQFYKGHFCTSVLIEMVDIEKCSDTENIIIKHHNHYYHLLVLVSLGCAVVMRCYS